MSLNFRSDLLKVFLQHTLAPFASAACLTGEGELLDIKYETLADVGTLGASAQTVTRYFPMQLGDVVILNDPYSGGTTLSMITIVTPLLLNHSQIPNLYLAIRTGFRPQLLLSKTLDEEGLRIPPTPIAQNRILNEMILAAISSHPLCPSGLVERIKSELVLIWKRVDCFQTLLQKNSQFSHRSVIKDYLKSSRSYFSQLLQELPAGETKIETHLESGEFIRLRLDLSAEAICFDFSGTSTSQRLCLTDSATFGACFGAVAAFLQKPIPLNSGSFSLLHVTTPLGSFLNAKYPSPTFKGMTEGTSQVAGAILQALGEIVPQKKFSASAQTPTQISLEFLNGQRFFDSLSGGIGASSTSHGADAVPFWQRISLRNSIQEIETLFPLFITQVCLRKNSGGQGQFHGGDGLTKDYVVQKEAKLRWIMQHRKNPPKGLKGALDGTPPEIRIERMDGSQEILDRTEGEALVSVGDKISVSSAGGGGYGKA